MPPLTPTVRTLLIVLGVVFVGQTIVVGGLSIPITAWAALWPGLHVGLAWQWATHWVVAPIAHPSDIPFYAFSLFVLYLVLSPFELQFGARRVVQLAIVGIVGGALPVVLLGLVAPSIVGPIAGPFGPSWAWMGAFMVTSAGARVAIVFMPGVAMPPASLAALFLGLAAFQGIWAHDAAGFVHGVGAVGAGVLFGRWMLRARPGKGPTPKKKVGGRPRFEVIKGGADDDDKPRWLN